MKKNLKKLCLGLLTVVLTTSYVSAQLTFGTRAGFNYTNMSYEFDGKKIPKEYRNKFKSGFQIGVVADYKLSEELSIQPGILFAQQGYKSNPNVSTTKSILNLNYLQVPINAQLKFPLGGIDLLIQTGPYFGFGINGKTKYWDENGKRLSDEDYKELFGESPKISFGSNREKDAFKGFDFGMGFGVGLQFSNIQAGLGYNIGFINLYNRNETHEVRGVVKNNGLALTVTYLFGN